MHQVNQTEDNLQLTSLSSICQKFMWTPAAATCSACKIRFDGVISTDGQDFCRLWPDYYLHLYWSILLLSWCAPLTANLLSEKIYYGAPQRGNKHYLLVPSHRTVKPVAHSTYLLINREVPTYGAKQCWHWQQVKRRVRTTVNFVEILPPKASLRWVLLFQSHYLKQLDQWYLQV